MALHVFVPTRSRPASMTRLSEAFDKTCLDNHTHLHWIVDHDDPEIDEYRKAFERSPRIFQSLWLAPSGPPGIVHPLNWVIRQLLIEEPEPGTSFNCDRIEFVGFMGDDHIPRTAHWDTLLMGHMMNLKTGIVYGDDLFQHERIPTSVYMTADIVQKLGFMAPPELRHLFVDDYWRDLGNGIDRLRYYPDIVIEHLHYLNSKASEDATYERNNNAKSATIDKMAYELYKRTGKLARDVASIRELL